MPDIYSQLANPDWKVVTVEPQAKRQKRPIGSSSPKNDKALGNIGAIPEQWMRALLLGSETSIEPGNPQSAPYYLFGRLPHTLNMTHAGNIKSLPSAALDDGAEVVFSAKLVRAPLCFRRLTKSNPELRPHTQNSNGLACCVYCPATDKTRLFARCFSDKCRAPNQDSWTELGEQHAKLLSPKP